MLLPDSGPAHIPDDITKKHIIKAETVTYNIKTPTSGQGLLVLYPNNPTGLVGTHYAYNDTTARYEYDATTGPLTTAQSLYNNYNYGRLSSQLLTVRSSTLAAGTFALSGTMNAVTIYGGLSEVSTGLTYGSVLSLNDNIFDKVGNVLASDGVAVLALPQTFANDYSRFNDPTPGSVAPGGSSQFGLPRLVDGDKSLVGMSSFNGTVNATAASIIPLVSLNIDSTTPLQSTVWMTYTPTAAGDDTTTMNIEALDAFGAVVYSQVAFRGTGTTVAGTPKTVSFNHIIPSSYYTSNVQPIAAIRINLMQPKYSWGANAALNLFLTSTALNSSMEGVNWPITIISYQGMAAGQVLTISGIANYELVPNAALRKNLPTEYGPYDKDELDYVKMVLSRRNQFQIRSVQSIPSYNRNRGLYGEMARLDTNEIAEAFDWGRLLRNIKNIFATGARTVFPAAAPLVGLANDAADALLDRYLPEESRAASGLAIGRAASGFPIGHAATGVAIGSGRRMGRPIYESRASDYVPKLEFLGAETMDRTVGSKKLEIGGELTPRGVLFPVIVFTDNIPGRMETYIAVPGNLAMFLPETSREYISESSNGKRVYGYGGDASQLRLKGDMTLLPVSRIENNHALIPDNAPVVFGTSGNAAMICADKGKFSGVPDEMVTGNMVKQGHRMVLMPNPAIMAKRQYADAIGMNLISGERYGNMKAVLSALEGAAPANRTFSQHAVRPEDALALHLVEKAYAMDEDIPPLPTEEELAIAPLRWEEWKEMWDEATQELISLEPHGVFAKAIGIINWVSKNNLVDVFDQMTVTDPRGTRTKVVLGQLVQTDLPRREGAGPTPNEAQTERARRLSEKLVAQYPDITAAWIRQNGLRGPTTQQAAYFRQYKRLPQPGEYEIQQADVVESILERVMKSFPTATNDQRQQMRQVIEDTDRGPNPEDVKRIMGGPRVDKDELVERVRKGNSITNPAAIQRLREFIERTNRGPGPDELAEIRQVARKAAGQRPVRRLEEQYQEAPQVFQRPAGGGRLQRMLARQGEGLV